MDNINDWKRQNLKEANEDKDVEKILHSDRVLQPVLAPDEENPEDGDAKVPRERARYVDRGGKIIPKAELCAKDGM